MSQTSLIQCSTVKLIWHTHLFSSQNTPCIASDFFLIQGISELLCYCVIQACHTVILQLSDPADTLPTTEESLKPSSCSEDVYQTFDKTDVEAPKSVHDTYESIKPSRITLTKLVKLTGSFITSKLRGSKNIKSDHSNRSKNLRNVS